MTGEANAPPSALRLKFCGLDFASPIVLLSGCVGFGEEYTRIQGFSNRDAGAVVLKGTTLAPRLGNPPHRVYETPAGMLNAIGLQNPGAEHVVRRILPALDFTETRFIANVSGSTVEEYAEVTRLFDQSPIDAIEINISCPNVKEGGVAFGNYPDMSAQVVEACRRVTSKPLITKLSPNQTDIRENARRCIEAGTDALSVINTMMGMAIDARTRRPIIGNIQGGLSGPAIKPIALLKVHQVYEVAKPHGIPIIGQGGITTATDAVEFLIAGATAVGIGTALFYDPFVCKKVNEGIAEYLRENGLESVVGARRHSAHRQRGSGRPGIGLSRQRRSAASQLSTSRSSDSPASSASLIPSSFSLRVRVLRPQPSSLAASCRWPWVRLSAARIRMRSMAGSASSSSGRLAAEGVAIRPTRQGFLPVGFAVGRAPAARISGGRSSTWISLPGARTERRRHRFTSSRTLPGQPYADSFASASLASALRSTPRS